MTNETKNLESIELMQRNEWEILLLFSGLGEENNKRIIKLYAANIDHNPTERILYSLLEWGGGGNFRNYINNEQIEWGRGGNWHDDKVFEVIKDPVLVMGELHQKVIHLDFKPENLIYVTRNEETSLKAIDFGGAKIFGINDQQRSYHSVNIQNQLCIISKNSPLSTKAYRSPEHRNLLCRQHNICPVHEQRCPENNTLCRKHEKKCHKNTYYLLSIKSDIWAIGAILIQIAMGNLLAKVANGDIAILNEDNQREFPTTGEILEWITTKYKIFKSFKEWNEIISNDSENIYDFLTLILETRICCPKTYLLIIATLQYNPNYRPITFGISTYLEGGCKLWFPEITGFNKEGYMVDIGGLDDIYFVPGLSINLLKGILKNIYRKVKSVEEKREKIINLFNLADNKINIGPDYIFNLPYCQYYVNDGMDAEN
uniref:Protein kinase domain-containing protein n=1 Tax=Meloidogyne enterolobii TaxID=390850 RepID=A0A6V7V2I9_MELEN|nr:unnamed protein product [Meloidogyne enterolobii]